MTQPNPTVRLFEHADAVLDALGVPASLLPIELYYNGVPHVYVALDSVEAVLNATPNIAALAEIPKLERINFFAGAGTNYTTRMFSPHDTVPEDPATGSAAGPLALHLVRHGWVASGEQITISQGEKIGRPSTLYATAFLEGEVTQIHVGGDVRIVGRGELWG
ncbi:MAG: PhzF family phenazine biosynthesis protein, partial [Corynebacteriales bacterium]|nr:PhzF family phenazine biosynthesis protein [Mycobacteriales bacterium]